MLVHTGSMSSNDMLICHARQQNISTLGLSIPQEHIILLHTALQYEAAAHFKKKSQAKH